MVGFHGRLLVYVPLFNLEKINGTLCGSRAGPIFAPRLKQ